MMSLRKPFLYLATTRFNCPVKRFHLLMTQVLPPVHTITTTTTTTVKKTQQPPPSTTVILTLHHLGPQYAIEVHEGEIILVVVEGFVQCRQHPSDQLRF